MEFILNLLHQSNKNGIGAFIFAILIYLSFYHFLLFAQNKKRYYLYYSIFAIFNASQLFGVLENVFFENYFKEISFRNSPFFYAFRTFSYMLFGMFMMAITDAKKEVPKFYKNNYISIWITLPIILGFLVWDYRNTTTLSYFLFQFFYFPMFTVITIVAIPLMLRFKSSIKYYLLVGVVSYNIINGVLYLLVRDKGILYENHFMFLFYASLLIENLLFTLALGKKERELFLEKNNIQEDYISQLNENQSIKEELSEKLEQKIIEKGVELELLNKQHLKQKEEKLVLELENLRQKIIVESLQNQMNPHFVFNALNSIKAYLIENDIENGIFYINKFSKLIRGILEGLRESHFSFKKEFELLDIFVKIESIRIKEEILFTVKNETNLSMDRIKISPLLLQPLVENSICHGFLGKKGEKRITIVIRDQEDCIIIEIKDNGVGLLVKNKNKLSSSSYGITLVKERLDYFNENKIPKSELLNIKKGDNSNSTGLSIDLKLKKEICLK